MNSIVRPFYDLIRNSLFCEEQLEPYRMNENHIADVFAWLDQRRRGFFDVSDFYSKFQDLKENELFYVFKFLDSSRKGAISSEDMRTALSSKQQTPGPQEDAIRNFSNFVRILKASFNLIEEKKRKLGITVEFLEDIFNKATQRMKERIDLMDIVVLFKENQLDVDEKLVVYLQEKIFNRSAITLKEFIHTFSIINWDEPSKEPSTNYKQSLLEKREISKEAREIPREYRELSREQRELSTAKINEKIEKTDKINSEIDRILQKYKNPSLATPTNKPIELEAREQFFEKSLEKKEKEFESYSRTTSEFRPNYVEKQTDNVSPFNSRLQAEFNKQKIEFQHTGLTTSASVESFEINKRREELRKGSLERQRIIDDIINKRKIKFSDTETTNIQPNTSYTSPYSHIKIETREDIESRFSKYHDVKPSTPTPKTIGSRTPYEAPSFDRSYTGKIYENQPIEKPSVRPVSASKTVNSFFDKSSYGKIINYDQFTRTDLNNLYKKSSVDEKTQKNYGFEKENILRRAEEEATKKIEEIERRARLKVMEKRSTAGVYNRWLK